MLPLTIGSVFAFVGSAVFLCWMGVSFARHQKAKGDSNVVLNFFVAIIIFFLLFAVIHYGFPLLAKFLSIEIF
jgi:hypothetical protein